jgi:hypothetical protein
MDVVIGQCANLTLPTRLALPKRLREGDAGRRKDAKAQRTAEESLALQPWGFPLFPYFPIPIHFSLITDY